MAITRHGLNRLDTGALARCSFEETVDILMEAAIHSEYDPMAGVSETIMLGQLARIGTGCFDLLLDSAKCQEAQPIPLGGMLGMGVLFNAPGFEGLAALASPGLGLTMNADGIPVLGDSGYHTPWDNAHSPVGSVDSSPSYRGVFGGATAPHSAMFSPAMRYDSSLSPGRSPQLDSPRTPEAFSPAAYVGFSSPMSFMGTPQTELGSPGLVLGHSGSLSSGSFRYGGPGKSSCRYIFHLYINHLTPAQEHSSFSASGRKPIHQTVSLQQSYEAYVWWKHPTGLHIIPSFFRMGKNLGSLWPSQWDLLERKLFPIGPNSPMPWGWCHFRSGDFCRGGFLPGSETSGVSPSSPSPGRVNTEGTAPFFFQTVTCSPLSFNVFHQPSLQSSQFSWEFFRESYSPTKILPALPGGAPSGTLGGPSNSPLSYPTTPNYPMSHGLSTGTGLGSSSLLGYSGTGFSGSTLGTSAYSPSTFHTPSSHYFMTTPRPGSPSPSPREYYPTPDTRR
uniref:DNA-directed RNA polymerase n=1 Tax=Schistosoma japonicum TaxID=6182 RepID=Q5DD92_SCHJA|nr:SJCHGC09439 protein [Schistosoma japonicum]